MRFLAFLFRSRPVDHADLRRHGRVPIAMSEGTHIACNLGRVVDLSAGGVRIERARPLADRVQLRLGDDLGGIECEAKVARCRKLGFFRWEVGLQLPPLDDRDRATLTRLCTAYRDRRTMVAPDAA